MMRSAVEGISWTTQRDGGPTPGGATTDTDTQFRLRFNRGTVRAFASDVERSCFARHVLHREILLRPHAQKLRFARWL